MKAPVTIFYSYAEEDRALQGVLVRHLSLLKQQGVIAAWDARQITPGDDWQRALDEHLDTAQIILLLISADFLASDYCSLVFSA